MKIFSRHGVVAVFLALFLFFLVSFNATKPRIVVLHSSGQTLPWAVSVDAGINRALANNRMPISMQWHYMDLENKPNADQRNVAVADAKRFISQSDPDILIAVDDETSALVAKDYVGLDRPKVLFVSIDQKPEVYGYKDAKNVTGIAEILPIKAIHEGLNVARPGRPAKIAAISVNNETGQAEMKQALDFDWKPHTLIATQKVNHFGEWQEFVQNIAKQADILLVFSSDGLVRAANDVQVVSAKEITQWTETNSVPLPVGVNFSFVSNGGGLMFSPSASDYGEQSINMALGWLSAPANSPPPQIKTSPHFHVGVRAQSLKNRSVILPDIYIETARIGNSYYP
jgi:hypothetical protein